MPSLPGNKQLLPSISFLIGRAFSIFRKKKDGPNPSDIDIKVSIPAPTYCSQFKKMFDP